MIIVRAMIIMIIVVIIGYDWDDRVTIIRESYPITRCPQARRAKGHKSEKQGVAKTVGLCMQRSPAMLIFRDKSDSLEIYLPRQASHTWPMSACKHC